MKFEQDYAAFEHKYWQRKERRRLEGLWWAVVFIWAGLVIGVDSLGYLPQIGNASSWSWIFLGAGMVGIFGSLYRLISPDFPNPIPWDWVWGSICLIIGFDGFVALNISWPLILIVIGGIILINGFWWRD